MSFKTDDTTQTSYFVHLPKDYDPAKKSALLFFLHVPFATKPWSITSRPAATSTTGTAITPNTPIGPDKSDIRQQRHLENSRIKTFSINISPKMVDLSKKVKVYVNGKLHFDEKVTYEREFLPQNFEKTKDRKTTLGNFPKRQNIKNSRKTGVFLKNIT